MDQPVPQITPNQTTTSDDPLANGTYIRTFAKDVAKMTGKPVTTGIPMIPKKELDLPKQQPVEATAAPMTAVEKKPANFLPETQPATAPAPEAQKASALDAARTKILSRLQTKAPKTVEEPRLHTIPQEAIAPIPKAPDAPAPFHTFKTDFEDKAKQTRSSKLSVLAAEGDAPKIAPKKLPSRPGPNRLVVAVGALILFAGIIGLLFAIRFATTKPGIPIVAQIPSVIVPDDTKALEGTAPELIEQLASLGSGLAERSVVVAYLSGVSTTSTENIPLPGGLLFKALSLPAPDLLLRNVADESTVGAIRAGGQTRPFFILKVDSYERTFAGMLAWEGKMAKDLELLYPPYAAAPFLTSTSTASSTGPTPMPGTTSIITPPSAPTTFNDVVVANHDVRVLFDASRRPIIMYGYRDRATLIIARDQDAFVELLSRLDAAK